MAIITAWTSPDATHWAQRSLPLSTLGHQVDWVSFTGAAGAVDEFLVYADAVSPVFSDLWRSGNGAGWTRVGLPSAQTFGAAYPGTAVGSAPGIMSALNVTGSFPNVGEVGTSNDGATFATHFVSVETTTPFRALRMVGRTSVAALWLMDQPSPGSPGNLVSSSDTVSWSSPSTPMNPGPFFGAVYGLPRAFADNGTRCVIVGDTGSSTPYVVAMYSDDGGVTWTASLSGNPMPTLVDVCWAPSIGFVAVGVDNPATPHPVAYVSATGATWAGPYAITALGSGTPSGIAFSSSHGLLLVTNSSSGFGPAFVTSTDGATWAAGTFPTYTGGVVLRDVAWSPTAALFCVVGAATSPVVPPLRGGQRNDGLFNGTAPRGVALGTSLQAANPRQSYARRRLLVDARGRDLTDAAA